MLYGHNPYTVILNLIEKAISTYDNFTKRELRKFRYGPPRLRELRESGKRFLCFLRKID